ncbi:hypothetical protein [Actibacterium lipolyticum]|uniref:Uncharacterized protein n=1 Tax=Actibacterium lipolyticum TaxID=1524263 RepID=A0A238JSL8_9RHOB|nr:hypothetical protein [Actibacterium lipolyticum]SMX33651.1 hypothetical protein COL8621_01069 [Actibacterium lipolyticum]
MPNTPRIATCCYCGTRAALILKGDVRHELSCSACGAPLHAMKRLKEAEGTHKNVKAPVRSASVQHTSEPRKRKKKKKPLKRRILSEVFDIIEDIFD